MANIKLLLIKLIWAIIASLGLFALAICLALNFKIILTTLGGVILAGSFWLLITKKYPLKLTGRAILFFSYMLIILGCNLFVIYNTFFYPTRHRFETMSPYPPLIGGYELTITHVKGNEFILQEEVFPPYLNNVLFGEHDGETPQILEREAFSYSKGFLLQELKISPLQANAQGFVELVLPDGTNLKGEFCGSMGCPVNTVKLVEFPKDSFYAAKNAVSLKSFDYLETTTTIWSVYDPDSGIFLAYIPQPYEKFRGLVTPLIGVAKVNEWVFGLIGLLITFFITPIIVPLVKDEFKQKIMKILNRPTFKKDSNTVKLIVSPKGDEKEIEVKSKDNK